jgi:hypothetical protein
MKHKVKKFGRGGDIVTGLGAVLLGKALYDKYKGGKDQDSDSGIGLKKPKINDEVDKAQESSRKKSETPIQDTDERIRANKASKGQPEMGDATNDGIVTKETIPAAQSTTPSSSSSQNVNDPNKGKYRKQRAPSTGALVNPKDAYRDSSGTIYNERGEPFASTKTETKASNPNKKGAGRSRYPASTETPKPPKKGAGRSRYATTTSETRMKKGGSVSSASKRADGIAIRGKTRA